MNVDFISDASISAERASGKTRFLKLCLDSKSFSSPLFDVILPTIRALLSRRDPSHGTRALTNAKVPAGIHEENQDRRISRVRGIVDSLRERDRDDSFFTHSKR